MAPFKVIIVGGSLTGLALANMLEYHGIDYEVLEAYPTIAPDLGFGLGLQPDGARILEQLGCYDELKKRAANVEEVYFVGPRGEILLDGKTHGHDLAESLGNPIRSLPRRDIIQILYDNLKDKTKVHPGQRVTKITSSNSGVTVTTEDGSTWTGSIVVGADGVRSTVRREMWRIAEEKSDPIGEEDKESMSSTYTCLFGSSPDVPRIRNNAFYMVINERRSYLILPSRDGITYWFCFVQNEKVIPGPYGRRFSAEDEQKILNKYLNDHMADGVTFADFYRLKKRSALLTLEEGVMKHWSSGRIVLVGDAAHKIHPISGAGGGRALVSAASLANELAETLRKEPDPSDESIRKTFQQYQNEREKYVREAVAHGTGLQQMEMLDGSIPRFLQLFVIPRLPMDFVMADAAALYSPAQRLAGLPVPSSPNATGFDDDVRLKPDHRASGPTILFILSLFLVFLVSKLDFLWSSILPQDTLIQEDAQIWRSVYPLVFSVIWTIESYRVGSTLSPLWSGVLWALMAHIFGYEIVSILYISVYTLVSQNRPFYYPMPRAIQIPTAQAFFAALVFTSIIPVFRTFGLLGSKTSDNGVIFSWQTAQLCYPIMVFTISKLFKSSSQRDTSIRKLKGDIKYIVWTLLLVLAITGIAYVSHTAAIIREVRFSPSLAYQLLLPLNPLTSCIFMWCIFTVWDLERVNFPQIELRKGSFYTVLVSALFGSPAMLALLWLRREQRWEQGREKINS